MQNKIEHIFRVASFVIIILLIALMFCSVMQMMLSILNDIMKISRLIIKVAKDRKFFDRQKVLEIAIKSCEYVSYFLRAECFICFRP